MNTKSWAVAIFSNWIECASLITTCVLAGVAGVLLLIGWTSSASAASQAAGVAIGPNYTQQANAGESILYTHILTNTGAVTDTFLLQISSTQGWPVALLGATYPTGTLWLPLQVGSQMTASFQASVTVPSGLAGVTEITIITATSQTSPTVQAVAVDTTIVLSRVYLPAIFKRWPPIPDAPVLNAIDNADGDGNYNVTWNAAYLAETYTLQEATDAAFANPTTPYSGAGTSWTASGKTPGKYYHRVKASNAWGDSAWSNVQSVSVQPPGTFYSVADADVIQGYPSSNTGQSSDMWVGYHWGACTQSSTDGLAARSLIQFDVADIPPGTSISQATLNVRLVGLCWMSANTGSQRTITTYRTNAPWSETSVTWNTQPGFAESYGSTSIVLNTGQLKWYALDVTDLVRGWVNGSVPNYGLMLIGPESPGGDRAFFTFAAREWSASYAPYLNITYTGMATLDKATAPEEIPHLDQCQATAAGIVVCAPADETVKDKNADRFLPN